MLFILVHTNYFFKCKNLGEIPLGLLKDCEANGSTDA